MEEARGLGGRRRATVPGRRLLQPSVPAEARARVKKKKQKENCKYLRKKKGETLVSLVALVSVFCFVTALKGFQPPPRTFHALVEETVAEGKSRNEKETELDKVCRRQGGGWGNCGESFSFIPFLLSRDVLRVMSRGQGLLRGLVVLGAAEEHDLCFLWKSGKRGEGKNESTVFSPEFLSSSLFSRRKKNSGKKTHVRLRPVDGVVDPAAGLLDADASPLGLF